MLQNDFIFVTWVEVVYYAGMTEQWDILVTKAKDGDKDAFGKLYGMYMVKIYRFAYFLLQDKTAAEDITQETFLKAWKAITRFSPKDGGTFQAFLFAIARNLVTDVRRKKPMVSLSIIEEPGYTDDIEERLMRLEKKERVREVLQRLSPFEQHMVILRFFEELPFTEIAKALDMKEGAIRVRLHRILKGLKTYLEKTL